MFLFQDQCDVIEKHTQSGLDLVDRYVKFVKERTEIEQAYAKQLRSDRRSSHGIVAAPSGYVTQLLSPSRRGLTKKYQTKRGNKDEQDCK